jgi:hypothetical protein
MPELWLTRGTEWHAALEDDQRGKSANDERST